MTRQRIRLDSRCEDPSDPRWARVFEPPPAPEVPELDLPSSGVYPTKEAIARMTPAAKALCRIELMRRAARKGQP